MPGTNEHRIPGESIPELLDPTFIARIASRLFNDIPEAGSVPRHEADFREASDNASVVAHAPAPPEIEHGARSASRPDYVHTFVDQPELPYFPDLLPSGDQNGFYFLKGVQPEQEAPLEEHANKLTEQQAYSANTDGSYGLGEVLNRDEPSGAPVLPGLPDGVPADLSKTPVPPAPGTGGSHPHTGAFSFDLLYDPSLQPGARYAPQAGAPGLGSADSTPGTERLPEKPHPEVLGHIPDTGEGRCLALELFSQASDGELNLDSVFRSYQVVAGLPAAQLPGAPLATTGEHGPVQTAGARDALSGGQRPAGTPAWSAPHSFPAAVPAAYSVNPGRHGQAVSKTELFDVLSVRRDFPVLHQDVHGKPLVWFDNAATTQKPISVINAVSHFYATDNSNIHRGAHTLAARATDAYEGAREKIRQFIGAGSTSEIIYVRGTTEGINLVAQTWARKFLQPGDEIVLSILEHHANIVPWQMAAHERGARIRVVPVNDHGEIILEEYTRLLNPRTRIVSLTQASNGLGTILPVREMIRLARRYDAKVLVDGAQSVAHIPVNVQELDADFFVFSGHKIFAPTGIGVVYGKRELLELMPPWQGGGNMIRDVRFEETLYNEPPAKFEAGTPSIADAVGLGAALDYVRKLGIENIARYEHFLLEYATPRLQAIPGLRLIGTAREKVGVLSFVLDSMPNEEVGRILDQEGIAVRSGHHCTQPSLRRFGVEGTVRPSLAFYNTTEEIDRLVDVIKSIQRRR